MKGITPAFIIVLLALGAIGQSKPAALKFDEFVLDDQFTFAETEGSVRGRIDRLAKRLRLEKIKNVFIIRYKARVSQDSRGHRLWNLVHSAQWSITGKTVTSEDVHVMDGGLRQHDTVEFWIAPKNADPPTPTPTFTRSEGIECPSIYAYQTGISFDKSTPIIITAESSPPVASAYKWTISDGVVVGSNEGTRLEVDVGKVRGNRITAFLEVEGVPIPCKNRAIVSAEFGNTTRLIDEFGPVSNGEVRGRLDSFLASLSQNPSVQGYVYIYAGRGAQGRDAETRKRLLSNHFMSRGFDVGRITIVKAGFREDLFTQLWMVPPGADMPKLTPSVDESFLQAAPRAPAKRTR